SASRIEQSHTTGIDAFLSRPERKEETRGPKFSIGDFSVVYMQISTVSAVAFPLAWKRSCRIKATSYKAPAHFTGRRGRTRAIRPPEKEARASERAVVPSMLQML